MLVDGSSYLYRAFHALPDLRTRLGEPTGALRGVLSMLRRLVIDGKPDYFAVVFDAPGKTFRDDWYPEYKANRAAMPDDLTKQIEPLHALVRANGWPLLMVPGVEADDVIGTLAKEAEAAGIDTVISSSDKDLAQLVNARIKMINTMSNDTYDEAGVIAKFGVAPTLIPDYLALVGDSADGYPGIAGIGAVSAARMLNRYGAIETFPPEVLGERREQALLFKTLATLRDDALLFRNVDDLQWQGPKPAFDAWAKKMDAESLVARCEKLRASLG